jgi:FKBP-type peptidyl-prolyl cis-trans isomerase
VSTRHFSFLALFIAATIASCEDSAHPGYSEAEQGIYYKLHVPGETGKKAGPDDFYEVYMLNRFGGQTFFDSYYMTGRGTILMQSSASRYFSVLSEGDSATFLLPGGDLALPGMPDTGLVEMNVKILRVLTADEAQQLEKNEDPDAAEQLIINRYLGRNKLSVAPDSSGLYFINEKEGTGEKPAAGKKVTVTYTGSFFSGQPFDRAGVDGKPAFAFTWGEEGQMLPGIIQALSHMRPGGKAKIILPSRLAFGAGGSSGGIVPPHTPVVYELTLVSIE